MLRSLRTEGREPTMALACSLVRVVYSFSWQDIPAYRRSLRIGGDVVRRRIVRKVREDGTVQLPRSMREALEISNGDTLLLQVDGDGDVVVRKPPRLRPHK